jgi:hypothetical protein
MIAYAHEQGSRNFLLRIEETGWLEHLRNIMDGSILVAEKLRNESTSVLVHCSDGWDRTSQVITLIHSMG